MKFRIDNNFKIKGFYPVMSALVRKNKHICFSLARLIIKASPVLRGFLVGAVTVFVFTTGILIFKNYLDERDNFLSLAPKETIFYWHSEAREKEEIKTLLFTTTCQLFNLPELSFLNENISRAKEISFAFIYPAKYVLFFTSEIDKNLKDKLEESDLNYILENETIIVTNSKSALLEIVKIKSKKNSPLSSKFNIKLNLNLLSFKYPTQVYLDANGLKSFWKFQNLSKIFPRKSKLVIIPSSQNKNSPSWSRYDYLLISTSPTDSQEMENFIKEKIAEQLPILKETTLPDKTVVKEQIADPSLFQFQKISISNFNINYIFEPKLNFEFAYSQNGKLFISNSKSLLENYLKDQKQIKYFLKKYWENIFKDKRNKYLGISFVDRLWTTY